MSASSSPPNDGGMKAGKGVVAVVGPGTDVTEYGEGGGLMVRVSGACATPEG